MPKLVNRNPHPIRVERNGKLVKIHPGQVVDADGEYADALLATVGVESASQGDERAYDDRREAGRISAGGERLSQKQALGPRRTALRHAVVAAPLRRVVGDDAAPFGPPSGTVTTKGALTAGKPASDPDVQHFAPNEAKPGDALEAAGLPDATLPTGQTVNSSEIHNSQVANAEAAEAIAEEIASAQVKDRGVVEQSGDVPAHDDGTITTRQAAPKRKRPSRAKSKPKK